MCLVAWPLSRNEARVDFKTKSTPASLLLEGQVTKDKKASYEVASILLKGKYHGFFYLLLKMLN